MILAYLVLPSWSPNLLEPWYYLGVMPLAITPTVRLPYSAPLAGKFQEGRSARQKQGLGRKYGGGVGRNLQQARFRGDVPLIMPAVAFSVLQQPLQLAIVSDPPAFAQHDGRGHGAMLSAARWVSNILLIKSIVAISKSRFSIALPFPSLRPSLSAKPEANGKIGAPQIQARSTRFPLALMSLGALSLHRLLKAFSGAFTLHSGPGS